MRKSKWGVAAAVMLIAAACLVESANAAIDDALSDSSGPAAKPEAKEGDVVPAASAGATVVVPIPQSNPTLGTGLAVLGMYYHSQTAEEARVQPASLTQAFGLATSNGTRIAGVGHKQYWSADDWRFSGVAGYGHVNLDFFGIGAAAGDRNFSVRWTVDATIAQAKLYRRLSGPWYAGVQTRYIEGNQSFASEVNGNAAELGGLTVRAVGVGVLVERDTRDSQSNAYAGSFLQFDTMFNRRSLGGDQDYDSLRLRYRAYFPLRDDVVLAFDADSCSKSGDVPLFDRCFLQLRGFSATRYIGRDLLSGQVEGRWNVYRRFGLVAFAGAGAVAESVGSLSRRESATSFGVGVRYMVLESQRINLRLDFARGEGSSAVYLSVTEAF